MFLALKPRKAEEKPMFFRDLLRNVLWISLAEAITYPFSLMKARKCTYPPINPKFSELLLFRGLFYGFHISLQRTILTFLLRSQLFQLFWAKNRDFQGFRLGKYQETCVVSALLPCFLLNFLNLVLIRAQCSKLSPNMKRKKLIGTLKALKKPPNSDKRSYFQLAKTGLFSFVCLNVAQSLLEVGFFARFYEKKPEKHLRCVVFTSFFATFIVHPAEFLNIRLVLRGITGLKTPNFVKYGFLLAKNEGISVFYRGFALNFLRNSAFNYIIFKQISHNFEIAVH